MGLFLKGGWHDRHGRARGSGYLRHAHGGPSLGQSAGFGWDDMTDAQRGDHHTLARAAIVHGEGYGRVKRVAT